MSKGKKKKQDGLSKEEELLIETKVLERLDTAKLHIIKTFYEERNEKLIEEVSNAEKELQNILKVGKESNTQKNVDSEINSYELQEKTEKMTEDFKKTAKKREKEKAKNEETLKKLTNEKAKEIQIMTNNFNNEIRKKEEEIKDLIDKFTDISSFNDREKIYIENIASYEKKLKELDEIHIIEIKKIERMFANQRDQNEREYQAKIDEIMKDAHILAEKEALDSDKIVEKKNNKLMTQLELQKIELSQIKEEHYILTRDNLGINDKMIVVSKSLKDLKNVNYKQTLKTKKLNEKIEFLKKYISNEVIKFTKELELMKNNNAKEIYDFEYKIKVLREQIKMKNKEIKTVKSLSQMILDQRSELEEFFLEALSIVRKEILVKKQNEELPSISKSQDSKENNEKIEKKIKNIKVSDMNINERDRIMRIIFSKMNSGQKIIPWRREEFFEN